MKNRLILILSLLAIFGCSRVQTLNMREHSYSKKPQKIIWLQVAGFSDELLPLLKFNNLSADISLFADRADCVGKMWNYNLFKLRPKASSSFLSQMYGLKNVSNECETLTKDSVISSYAQDGYQTFIFESSVADIDSLDRLVTCKNIENVKIFKMSQAQSTSQLFHYQELLRNLPTGVYYDKACQKGSCYSSLISNLKSVLTNLVKDSSKSLIIVRDYSLMNAIRNKDINLLKESLGELGQITKWFELNVGNNALILVTGAESTMIDYPAEGVEWEEYLKANKNIFFRTNSLLSTAISKGAMAENFCGLFDESEVFNRLNYETPKRKFDWDNINPLVN
jgi:hypothetical protein